MLGSEVAAVIGAKQTLFTLEFLLRKCVLILLLVPTIIQLYLRFLKYN